MISRLKIDKTPRHLQAQQYLLGLIKDGVYQPGERLPAEVDLAAQLGISRPTLREALLHLEQENVIVRKHGVGTFVANGYGRRLESGLEHLESVLTLAAQQGMTTHVHRLSVEQIPAGEELAERLEIATDTLITRVQRTISIKHRPSAYLVDYSPVSILPPEAFDASFGGSVLDLLMQRQDIRVREALTEITAISADELLAERLEIEVGQATLLLTETLFADDNTPLEFSRNYFLPNFFRFHVLRR